VGLVGFGYWGTNVARNLDGLADCELIWFCDPDDSRRAPAAATCPGARFSTDLDDLLGDETLDAVAIATPVSTHAGIAERAIAAGKHCFVEKPLAQSVGDAERVSALALEMDRLLMVGHLLEYHPGVEALKDLIDAGQLGEVHYIYSQRLNLGKLRADENALWSLGAHDVSMILKLLDESPSEVSARGESYVRTGVEDMVFAHLRFASGIVAHLHLSWLDPHKERRLTVVGSQRMATFDDMAETKLTVFDKGFDLDGDADGGFVARSGGVRNPDIDDWEPLRVETEHFIDCVRNGRAPRTDGASGLRVVRVLDALQRSLEADGSVIRLEAQGAKT
jgi:predicted dehydrogenase